MLGLLLFIFRLVSFNDFEAAHNLVIAPVLMALVGIYIRSKTILFTY